MLEVENTSTISIRDLTIGYAQKKYTRVVTEHITADLKRGQLTVLIGANGIGKSTLLKTLSGFNDSLSGEVLIEGQSLKQLTKKQMSRIVSVVLTDRTHVHNLTVRELVGMGRSPYTNFWGTIKPEDENIINQAISQVGITSLADRMIDTLSDGERQKALIAKAIAQQTPTIFLDEPTAFLDYPSKVEILLMLRSLSHEQNKTVFLSTHDLELAIQIADNVWLMTGNEIKIGTPQQLAEDGSLAHCFSRPGLSFDAQHMQFKVL